MSSSIVQFLMFCIVINKTITSHVMKYATFVCFNHVTKISVIIDHMKTNSKYLQLYHIDHVWIINGLYPGYNLVVSKVNLCSTQSSNLLYPRFHNMILIVY